MHTPYWPAFANKKVILEISMKSKYQKYFQNYQLNFKVKKINFTPNY